jgi:hypothetical protein
MNHGKAIYLTYLNIRHSISILLLRLILVDLLAAALLVLFYFSLIQGQAIFGINLTDPYMFLAAFAILGSLKIITTIYVVLQWLNEYYEITPDEIVHKRGIIFKKVEKYKFDNIRAMELSQNFTGGLLNFGTITLYDMRMQKYLDMYLIHNPKRYYKVIKSLNPGIEYKTQETIVPALKHSDEEGER